MKICSLLFFCFQSPFKVSCSFVQLFVYFFVNPLCKKKTSTKKKEDREHWSVFYRADDRYLRQTPRWLNHFSLDHSRHQSLGSTQSSGELCVGEHAPYGSYNQKLAIWALRRLLTLRANMNAPIRDFFDCSSRKPMRRHFVSGFPRALLSLSQKKSSGVEIVIYLITFTTTEKQAVLGVPSQPWYTTEDRPQHRELHALLVATSVRVLLRPTGLILWTLKGCETGPPAYRPYPRRLESLNHLKM